MRRINSITFVVSCLLILLLFSCGNLVSKNTGAIVIALPGAEAARGYVPNDNDFANAQYNIVVVDITNSNRKVFQEKKNAGETLVVDIASGKYEVDVEAHVSNGYIMGRSLPVKVTVGNTAVAEISMGGFLPQYSTGVVDNQALFRLTRQPEDYTQGYDCYLIGKGKADTDYISIKPNLDRRDINAENWQGEWPFKITEYSKFWLGGTFEHTNGWHDPENGIAYLVDENGLPDEWIGKGFLELPDLSAYSANNVKPSIEPGNHKISWNIDNVLNNIDLPGEVWCKIGILVNQGDWITGTHFRCDQPDSIEYQKLIDGGVTFRELSLYENMQEQEAIEKIGGAEWYVQCSLFWKPYGEESTWQIELPVRSSKESGQ